MIAPVLPEDEAVASLFPLDLSGDVVALRACIDAGTQDGIFCVAGVAFGYDRAVKANHEWRRLMKGRTFHMTDLNSRQGEFEGIEDDEVREIVVGTVDIIRRHASYVTAASCDAKLVAAHLPTLASKGADMAHMLAAFRSAYGLMCHFAMLGLGLKANENAAKPGRHISYVIEQGDEGQRGVRAYLDFLGDEPHHKIFLDGYSLNRFTIADKDEIEGIFHASDLVAWEWARHVGRHYRGEPMRKSLSELVRVQAVADEGGVTLSDGRRFFLVHFSEKDLAPRLTFFRENLAATSRAEAEDVFRRYREAYPAKGRRP